LDDCVSNDQTIRRTDNRLKDLAFLGRHLRISTIYTSQRSVSINCDIRSQCDSMILFHVSSKRELNHIKTDYNFNEKLFFQATSEQYSFVHFLKCQGKVKLFNSKNKELIGPENL
jgi:hypothetical protein